MLGTPKVGTLMTPKIMSTNHVPLYVSTKMASKLASIEKSSFFIPTPEKYAQAAIRRIGYEARCTPYMTHSIQWFFASLLPESILDSWRLSIGLSRRGKIDISY
ncbi:hypothetical protein HYC85_021172 [Camellia sinensis]|uniref:Uncharacterized protein n=1 Tax=Camellia sinensis TaxID=4442 RepID=A0A7J7GIC0_CAMSI|nr:hypothetical protein HYC85_021172 [Camellia sinensis]